MRSLQDRSSKNEVYNDSPVFIGGQDVARAAIPATVHSLSAFEGM
jgi:hypothetical protein